MENLFKLRIVTPSKVEYDGDAYMLSVYGIEGSLSILHGHIPFVTPVKEGKGNLYLQGGKIRHFSSASGLLTVSKDITVLLTDSFAWDEEQ